MPRAIAARHSRRQIQALRRPGTASGLVVASGPVVSGLLVLASRLGLRGLLAALARRFRRGYRSVGCRCGAPAACGLYALAGALPPELRHGMRRRDWLKGGAPLAPTTPGPLNAAGRAVAAMAGCPPFALAESWGFRRASFTCEVAPPSAGHAVRTWPPFRRRRAAPRHRRSPVVADLIYRDVVHDRVVHIGVVDDRGIHVNHRGVVGEMPPRHRPPTNPTPP